jgi:FkbM family methyltransferase
MNKFINNKIKQDSNNKLFCSFLQKRPVRNLIIIMIVTVIMDIKYADIHGRVLRKFKRDQRYYPSNSIHSACRASFFREFRPAPVTSVISKIIKNGEKLECNLNAGLSIGYNCQNWWNPMARKVFYMFFTLDPEIDEYVSRHMLQNNGIFDKHVHGALETVLQNKPLCDSKNPILDVGSNLGSLTLATASLHGCVVHAFEMQKDIACRLSMSASSNSLINELIFVHNVAVSSIDGEKKSYNTNEQNPGGTAVMDVVATDTHDETSNIVTTVTLDNLFYGKVESIPFVKIDTEGHEYEVLKSAKLLMSRNIIKHLVIEIRSHQTQMVRFLYENRFTCHLLEHEKKNIWNANPKCRNGEKLETLLSHILAIKLFSDLFCCHE